MDLIKFKERYPLFLNLMKEKGYHSGYISKFGGIIQLILQEGGDELISTFEQFYHHLVAHHHYTEGTCTGYKNMIGRLKVFIEEGIFLGDTGKCSGFLHSKSYDLLSPDFKRLIDSYSDIERKRGKLKESTIATNTGCASSFFYCIQQTGITSLSGIKDTQAVLQAFGENQKRHGYSVAKAILAVIEACIHLYPGGECRRIAGMIPEFPRRSVLYDYLQPEEEKIIAAALDDDNNKLSYRSKAIGKLAYYTGMRCVDIANLHFENIDTEKEEIAFIQQKTGVKVHLPLRPVVGNALYEYIVNERPKCNSDSIFIRTLRPFIPLSLGGVKHTAQHIFKSVNIRQEKSRNQGFHLFRHAFASGLVTRNISGHIVSELMGHTSIASLNPYLDADIAHLRECALSIAPFSECRIPSIAPFRSDCRGIIQPYVDRCMAQDIWCGEYHKALRSFDNFCAAFYPGAVSFSQEMFNQWYQPLSGESRTGYLKRTDAMRDFIYFLAATYTANIVIPETGNVDKRKRASLMKVYASTVAGLFIQFVNHRKTSGRWSGVYDRNLRSFDLHCATLYPNEPVLTQNMVDIWCEKRPSENQQSHGKRVAVVHSFLKYAFKRELLDIEWQSIPIPGPENRVVKALHAFTDVELENFFYACDHLQIIRNGLTQRLIKLTIPVFFRLLFSSGMRTNEARNLDVEDVDLKQGIINIRHTKGYIEHRVALHPTMQESLTLYDATIQKIMPGRKCFFPSSGDKYYSLQWMIYNFDLLWFKYNHHPATAYHLRHHFATTNMNSWPAQTEKFNKNLLYLSRSMGHSIVETTMYYYHFTPKLAEILKNRKTETFNEIIPERKQYFINDED